VIRSGEEFHDYDALEAAFDSLKNQYAESQAHLESAINACNNEHPEVAQIKAALASMTADRDHWREARRMAISSGEILKEEVARLRADIQTLVTGGERYTAEVRRKALEDAATQDIEESARLHQGAISHYTQGRAEEALESAKRHRALAGKEVAHD